MFVIGNGALDFVIFFREHGHLGFEGLAFASEAIFFVFDGVKFFDQLLNFSFQDIDFIHETILLLEDFVFNWDD